MSDMDSINDQQDDNYMINLYRTYVSKDQSQIDWILKPKNNNKLICGGFINEQCLSFQCFTCAMDPHHMICQKCFNPKQHENHRAIIRYDRSGCCDCGDIDTIIQEGFCQNHKGVHKAEEKEEINQIPRRITVSITKFINQQSQEYIQAIQQVVPQIPNYPDQILTIYEYALGSKYTKIIEMIQKNIPSIEQYYKQFRKAADMNLRILRLVEWLSNKSQQLLTLITRILMQGKPESLFGEFMKYQIYVEKFGLKYDFPRAGWSYITHGDLKFKLFTMQIYLKHFHELSYFHLRQYNEKEFKLRQIIARMKTEVFIVDSVQQRRIIKEYLNILKKYFEQEPVGQILEYKKTKFLIQHTQWISQQFLEEMFQSPYIKNLYNELAIQQQYLIDTYGESPQYVFKTIGIFQLRFEQTSSFDIMMSQLRQQFKNKFDDLSNNDLTMEQLSEFDPDEFIITALIQTSNLKPCRIQKSQLPFKNEVASLNYLAHGEIQYLSCIKTGMNWFLNTPDINCKFKNNIFQLCFCQSFKIVDKRNSLEDQLIQEFDQEEPYKLQLFQLFKNASVCDKIFTMFLSFNYFTNQPINGQQFQQLIMNILNIDETYLITTFKKILHRVLQNLGTIFEIPNFQYSSIYKGTYQYEEQDCQESYDLAFIKLSIFMFGDWILTEIQDYLKVIKIKRNLDLYVYIINEVTTSDRDLYNVVSIWVQKNLPDDLKNCLHKLVGNQFLTSPYQSFTSLQKNIPLMGISKREQFKEQILDLCELDPYVRQLKLKTPICYDPILISKQQKGHIIESFLDGKNQKINQHFGNSMEFDHTYSIKSHIRESIKNTLLNIESLKFYCSLLKDESINKAISLLYLIYNSHKYLLFRNKSETELLIDTLQYILKQTDSKKVAQYSQSFLDELIKPPKQIKPQNEVKFQHILSKFKQKMTQFQQTNTIIQEENEGQVCQSCKQVIDEDACMPILIQENNIHIYYNVLEQQDYQFQKFMNITVSNCKHIYHKSCLDQTFQGHIIDHKYPLWLRLQCPICKQALNLTMPIESTHKQGTQEFEDWLINLTEKFNFKKIDRSSTLSTLYNNLIVDLVYQLKYQTADFVKNDKYLMLKSIILICQQSEGNNVDPLIELVNDSKDNLMSQIIQLCIQRIQHQQIQIQIQTNEIIAKQLNFIFDIDIKQFTTQPENLYIDNIIPVLRSNLLENYELFYLRQFPKGCNECGYYPVTKRSRREELFLCLICFKQFCTLTCETDYDDGNLNEHAKQDHCGNCVYLSLQSNSLAIMSSPITLLNYKSLYQNNLGQQLNILNSKENLLGFILDEVTLGQIAQIIRTNSQKTIINSLQHAELNTDGTL